ncbi:phage tail protein [Actinoplanes awajinensis]|uniref:Uncharacterized protein n=1 Tax=Actinoplanes awajinensis subsp. mycoplanecinus TaxID=135947 RepID=A0A117MMP8_9ACTN|nr:phage tail protein [Actinoplanes awajinensis]KUL25601.1 hypothetical protein ADL15_40360 [Actinoplanes awajinensis subsp. mycoplanecinus]
MLGELTAAASTRPYQIDLQWTWSYPADGQRPPHRLRRCAGSFPEERPGRAGVLLTLVELAGSRAPGIRALHLAYRADGERPDVAATVTMRGTGAAAPDEFIVGHRDDAGTWQQTRLAPVHRIDYDDRPAPGWNVSHTLRVYDGPGHLAGTLTVRAGAAAVDTANEWRWHPRGGDEIIVAFARDHVRRPLRVAGRPPWWPVRRRTGLPGPPPQPLPASIYCEAAERRDADTGDWQGSAVLLDLAAEAGQFTYYELHRDDAGDAVQAGLRAWAAATGDYGWAGRLYRLLPAVHRRLDEPAPDRHDGELRRFLLIFETTLNHLQGRAEALRLRQDLDRTPPPALVLLAEGVGWTPDQTTSLLTQRHDIAQASALYRQTATATAVRALIHRYTGGDCRIKEHVATILRTNAPEPIPLWELWERAAAPQPADQDVIAPDTWTPARPVLHTERFDGRPATAWVPGDPPGIRRYFHSDRDGTRRLWLLRPGATEPEPGPGVAAGDPGIVEQEPAAAATDGTLWLVWSVGRGDAGDLWACRTEDGSATPPVRVTSGARAHRPAAAVDQDGRLWIFWEVGRSGRSDIWTRRLDEHGWSPAQRMPGDGHDHAPSAACDDDGRLWLAWHRGGDTGAGSALWAQVCDPARGSWDPPRCLGEGEGAQRDEFPSIVSWSGRLWVFWHSDRDGHWRLWGRAKARDDRWTAAFAATGPAAGDSGPPLSDKEPAAAVGQDGRLLLTWRSQRGGTGYQSRTVDTRNREALARLGRFDDRTHYLHDARAGQPHNLNTVSVHLDRPADPAEVEARLAAFQPLHTRYLCVVEPGGRP